jgi:hypothetical protein
MWTSSTPVFKSLQTNRAACPVRLKKWKRYYYIMALEVCRRINLWTLVGVTTRWHIHGPWLGAPRLCLEFFGFSLKFSYWYIDPNTGFQERHTSSIPNGISDTRTKSQDHTEYTSAFEEGRHDAAFFWQGKCSLPTGLLIYWSEYGVPWESRSTNLSNFVDEMQRNRPGSNFKFGEFWNSNLIFLKK